MPKASNCRRQLSLQIINNFINFFFMYKKGFKNRNPNKIREKLQSRILVAINTSDTG
jgi:hypothetical protein